MITLAEIKQQEENCYKCKFWKQQSFENEYSGNPEELTGGDLDGLCKRNSPKPLVSESPNMEDSVFVRWPTTYADESCGDFVLKIVLTKKDCFDESPDVLDHFAIPIRALCVIRNMGFKTIREVADAASDGTLLKAQNFGHATLKELRRILREYSESNGTSANGYTRYVNCK